MAECRPPRGAATCQSLDSLALEYFATLESVSVLRMQLDSTLRDGFLQMAKARYSMGNKRVTALQYDVREMSATKRVLESVTPADAPNAAASVDTGRRRRSFSVLPVALHDASLAASSVAGAAVPADRTNSSGVVPRRAPGDRGAGHHDGDDDAADDNADEDCPLIETRPARADSAPTPLNGCGSSRRRHCDNDGSGNATPSPVPPKDPLKWFGLLVPQSLKLSQLAFQRSLSVVCELASLHVRLQAIVADYRAAVVADYRAAAARADEIDSHKVEKDLLRLDTEELREA